MRPPPPSTRWLLVAAGVLIAITVAGLVVGAGDRGADLDEDEPAAAVRDFMRAFEDRDAEGMRATLAADLRSACSDEEVRRTTRAGSDAEVRATLVATEELDGHAEVEVRRTEHHGEPPFGGGYERTEVFELAREDGDWAITTVPWGYHACPGWSR